MRIRAFLSGLAACTGLAAACAQAQSQHSDANLVAQPTALCALTELQSPDGRTLVVETASGLSGHWRLRLGGPALSMEQSGDLHAGPGGSETLARIELDASAAERVSLDDLQPGQTVMSGGSGPHFGALTVTDDEGRILCTTEWEGA